MTMWNNTVELKMCCGICKTTVTTRVATLSERAILLRDFNEAHKDVPHFTRCDGGGVTPRSTVNIVCAKAPRRIGCVPAVNRPYLELNGVLHEYRPRTHTCSYCGARVKVVA